MSELERIAVLATVFSNGGSVRSLSLGHTTGFATAAKDRFFDCLVTSLIRPARIFNVRRCAPCRCPRLGLAPEGPFPAEQRDPGTSFHPYPHLTPCLCHPHLRGQFTAYLLPQTICDVSEALLHEGEEGIEVVQGIDWIAAQEIQEGGLDPFGT